ncbi:hypothetical protein AGOR_G00242300 [Albula goreensis]|uniref:Uncharacterized protein n=1 Tax=Albula goreensis TaxID=1534307 RepID=A0A8T3CJB0_9TELE|nr:hypothetical protein AGOR_G00242300 [Albula goreensis]
MSNESSILKNLTESVADVPQSSGLEENYVPLLVLLCVFAGTLLALLFVLLIFCRRCLRGGRRYSRASNDPEKTNTTYLEESQHVPEITIQVDESDHLSASSDHDADTDRFLSAVSTGRRVSFNESALLDHGKRAQERGRRYTLTEGDFHHLKNARLTHLHLPPPALRILTIHECDTSGNGIQQSPRPAPKPSLSIFQPPVCLLPQTALTGLSPSSALPGDTLNSVVDTSATDSPPTPPAGPPRSCTIEVMGHRTWNGGASAVDDEETSEAGVTRAQGQGSVLQFFTKLRRHASLEGPSPYFKIKKWKFDSSQRASSLDTRGSPKRHQFQRQRAASESMQQDAEEAQHMELVPSVPSSQQDEAYRPSFPSPPPTPPPSLHRLEMEEVVMEPSCAGAMGVSDPLLSHVPQDEVEQGAEPGPAVSFRQDSTEQQTLYRDIWTLRASLEQYASSDQSSNNDRDSVRSDADSVCSLGGPASRPGGLSSCPSQDTGDDPDEGVSGARAEDGVSSMEPERGGGNGGGSGSGSDGDSGNRKLLQMDSGYASIEAPSRAPEDLRLFGAGGGSGGGVRGKTASEKRHFFTSAGRKGSVCESVEARLFQEELEDQAAAEAELGLGESSVVSPWPPYGQVIPTKEVTKPRPQLFRRRDYSIDEKTDALFNEFLRHDPRFDQQGSPARPRPPLVPRAPA